MRLKVSSAKRRPFCLDLNVLTVNEYMNWISHTRKKPIAFHAHLIINILKRYLPISAMKLMYDSLILPHLPFGIINWGFGGGGGGGGGGSYIKVTKTGPSYND